MNSTAHKPLVYIISAPSGSGKSTLVTEVLKLVPDLDFSISYTTRPPRGSEQNGKQYYFVSREEFEEMNTQDEFLEHADVFGNYYGTARCFLRAAESNGHDLLLDIDVQGAAQLSKRIPDAVTIFILAPSREILEQRLRFRSQDSDEVIRRRLADAAREIQDYRLYDYVLVNEDLELAAETLKSIVRAERVKRIRIEDKIRPIIKTFSQALGD